MQQYSNNSKVLSGITVSIMTVGAKYVHAVNRHLDLVVKVLSGITVSTMTVGAKYVHAVNRHLDLVE